MQTIVTNGPCYMCADTSNIPDNPIAPWKPKFYVPKRDPTLSDPLEKNRCIKLFQQSMQNYETLWCALESLLGTLWNMPVYQSCPSWPSRWTTPSPRTCWRAFHQMLRQTTTTVKICRGRPPNTSWMLARLCNGTSRVVRHVNWWNAHKRNWWNAHKSGRATQATVEWLCAASLVRCLHGVHLDTIVKTLTECASNIPQQFLHACPAYHIQGSRSETNPWIAPWCCPPLSW